MNRSIPAPRATPPVASELITGLVERISLHLSSEDAGAPAPVARPSRKPAHTVYIPANRVNAETIREWGRAAHEAVSAAGGYPRLASTMGVPPEWVDPLSTQVESKLLAQPIEDLRVDFEDGYLSTADPAEDQDASRVGALIGTLSPAPLTVGLRIKSLESATRERGIRTLVRFLAGMAESSTRPAQLIVTLPKVTTSAQIEAGSELLAALEEAFALPPHFLHLEIQVEAPQMVSRLLSDGDFAELPAVRSGRVTGLHYGTYDYSAALGLDHTQQRMDHPAADFAKFAMQLAAAETGVRVSDGSTNAVPDPQDAAAWCRLAELVSRSLSMGFTQGWDLHPSQLPARFFALYTYFQVGAAAAEDRLSAYIRSDSSLTLDEPASARALASFLVTAVELGVGDPTTLLHDPRSSWDRIVALATPRPTS